MKKYGPEYKLPKSGAIPIEIVQAIAERRRIVEIGGQLVDIGKYPLRSVRAAKRIVKMWNAFLSIGGDHDS